MPMERGDAMMPRNAASSCRTLSTRASLSSASMKPIPTASEHSSLAAVPGSWCADVTRNDTRLIRFYLLPAIRCPRGF